MNHQEFIDLYLGKSTTFWEPYWAQCVSLSKQYTKDVLGENPNSYNGSAWNGYLNEKNTFPIDKWETGTWYPQQGDIIFFPRTNNNPYGHVAVAHNSEEMIEQNWSTGNGSWAGGDAIRLVPIRKDYAGYWRLRTSESPLLAIYKNENNEELAKPIQDRNLSIKDYEAFLKSEWEELKLKILIALERCYK